MKGPVPNMGRADPRRREDILEARRVRNIESAKRSRQRQKAEDNWMRESLCENEERIRRLERQVETLSAELGNVPKVRGASGRHTSDDTQSDRPAWFGDAF